MVVKRGFTLLGAVKESGANSTPISDDHRQLLRDFGPGEFLSYYDLLPASHTQTLAEQISEAAQEPYASSLIFATSSRGDIFVRTSEPEPRIVLVRDPYALTEPSATMLIGNLMDDWLRAIRGPTFSPPGLLVPYFIPIQPVERIVEHAALSPGIDQPAAMRLLRAQISGANGVILVYRDRQPAARMVAWFDAARTLVTIEVVEPEKTLAAFDARILVKQFADGHALRLETITASAGWEVA